MTRLTTLGLLAATITVLASCSRAIPMDRIDQGARKPNYGSQLGPGEYALRKVTDPARMPNLDAACADPSGLDVVLARSLNYLSKGSSIQFFPVSGISHERTVASLTALRELIATGKRGPALATEIRRTFDVYESIGYDRQGTVFFTGYYTPILNASRTRTSRFQYPLHKLPPNHVKDPVTGETIGLRRSDGSVERSYPDRGRLLSGGMLDGQELVWLEDAFEAYIASVQGSAILRLTDGSTMEVGYAGSNGHDYTAIGRLLVESGKLPEDQLNLQGLKDYFRRNPGELSSVTDRNARYIFFQQVTGGPFGSLNEQVTASRSIATDKSIFPRGAACIVEADLPQPDGGTRRISQIVADQDTGGAIRAPGRCDFFWGVGDAAEALAGRTMSEGRLFYLILSDSEYARRSNSSSNVQR